MQTKEPRYIIGIAASAGGLESISELVNNLPVDQSAAYVVAQHMSPKYKSLLPTLINRETKLAVKELDKPVRPSAGVVYVGPPSYDISYEKGKLHLRHPSANAAAPKPSADRLFKSLAAGKGPNCVGIVLSGTGTDGSYGVRAIHEAGGITIAQDLCSAKYDGMPTSATETGCVDLVLSPTEIAESIGAILSNKSKLDTHKFAQVPDDLLGELFQILLVEKRVDFRDYKETTIRRRIQRRMVALNIEKFEDYVTHCKAARSEIDALYKDLMISVTRFFRDPEHFAELEKHISDLVANQDETKGPIRIWVSGCATGEEAYSVAAIVAEAMGGLETLSRGKVQIFATDLNEDALKVARQGVYSAAAVEDIPEKFIGTMFDVKDDLLIVKRALRDVIYFSRHNLIQDPPFLNVQLVTLRNVLIYFNTRLQELVLGRVHYSLSPEGLLFLGTSETIGSLQRGFTTESEPLKIFRKRPITFVKDIHKEKSEAWIDQKSPRIFQPRSKRSRLGRKEEEMHQAMFDALAASMSANSLLVSRSHDVIRVYGNLSVFIELSQSSRLDVDLGLLKSPIREDAKSLCNYAIRKGSPGIGQKHRMQLTPGVEELVWVEAYPVLPKELDSQFALIAVHRQKISENERDISDNELSQSRIVQLRTELTTTREALQQSIEELQASNEELQMLNVQLQTSNQELQAANEEYETSNEELQSTNEELVTVNEEFQVFSEELKSSTAALQSVLTTASTAIVVVDTSLTVLNASKVALKMFGLSGQLSRRVHITDCVLPLGFPSLAELINETLRLREPQVLEFSIGYDTQRVQTTPFRDENGAIRGVTLVVLDGIEDEDAGPNLGFSRRPKAQESNPISSLGYFAIDSETGIVSGNQRFFQIFGMQGQKEELGLKQFINKFTKSRRSSLQEKVQNSFLNGNSFEFASELASRKKMKPKVRIAGYAGLQSDHNHTFLHGAVCLED